MSDSISSGFGKFVPGFDFLQNLAKGATQTLPQLPGLSSWVAPTLNVEELDKRIGELKAVHFWLDQNSKALGATIQALEVQKMTLATLKGMNFSMGELADALKLKAFDMAPAGVPQAGEKSAASADAGAAVTPAVAGKDKKSEPSAGVVDPLQWWGALTQQFQQIATDALQDAARNSAVDAARNMATGMAKGAARTAAGVVRAATPGSGSRPARKASPATRKTARKSSTRKPSAGA